MRVRPSEVLKEDIIEYLGWTVEEAAEHLNLRLSELVAVLDNRIPITPYFANRLEAAGHGTAASWLRLEERVPLLLYGLHKVPCGQDTMDARNIPEPFQSQFRKAMIGSGIPTADPNIFFAHDWLDWASGNWRWGDKPVATK